jgi:cysteinyl-tRNA synthetase
MKVVSEPAAQVETALNFAARRIDEIASMAVNGETIPESTAARYEQEVEQAIQFAMNQPDDQAVQSLAQIRDRLTVQLQVLEKTQALGAQQNLQLLQQTREMTQERLQWVENGLKDPQQLRDQLKLREREREQEQLRTCTPAYPGSATPKGPGEVNLYHATPTPGR